MGEEDTRRQAPNVARMQLLGAEVVAVTAGQRTLKEAINEAMQDWAASVRGDHYRLRNGRTGRARSRRWSGTSSA